MIMENSVYYRMNDNERAIMNKITELTGVNYELHGEFVPVESLMSAVSDLLYEIDTVQEKYDDIKNDLENNYRPIPYEEQV